MIAKPVPVRRLAGSFRELGHALGICQDWSLVLSETIDDTGLAGACHALATRALPTACEKLDGICDALEVPLETLAPWYYLRGARVGCTSFAFEDPAPTVGRAYHWVHEAAKWCEARLCEPEGRWGFVGYTHNACGVSDAMNERGLCVLISALAPKPTREPGLPWHALVDHVLSTADTTAEAVEFLARAPHLRPFLYFVADRHGDLAVVEALPGDVRVRRPEGGVLVATNYALHTGHPSQHEARHWAAEARLRALGPSASVADIRSVLRSHAGPFCTGRHPSADSPMTDQEWYTLWAATVRPTERAFEIAPGRPCETEFTMAATWNGAWHVPSVL